VVVEVAQTVVHYHFVVDVMVAQVVVKATLVLASYLALEMLVDIVHRREPAEVS
jgi:hypothetical protein